MLFKLSHLSSAFALTLGHLNWASNDPALKRLLHGKEAASNILSWSSRWLLRNMVIAITAGHVTRRIRLVSSRCLCVLVEQERMERDDWGYVEARGDSWEGKISNRWVLPTPSKLWSAKADYEELTDGLVLIIIKGKIFRMNDNLHSVER